MDPKTVLPDPTAGASKSFTPGGGGSLANNPNIAPTVFPLRQQMLQKFVAMYQAIELDSLDPAAQEQSFAKIIAEIQAESDRIAALPKKTKADVEQAAKLEKSLKSAGAGGKARLSVAQTWRKAHAPKGMTDAQLEAEVTRLAEAMQLPPFVAKAMLEFGGMRYGRTDTEASGGKTAHGSYYSPQRFLWAVAMSRDGKLTKEDQSAFFKLSTGEALGRIKDMHSQGKLPEFVWRRLVYRTDLRTEAANTDADWNKLPDPEKGPDKKVSEADGIWLKALELWTSGPAAPGGGSVVGATGWRQEMYQRAKSQMVGYSANIMLGVVCNELSEAIMADNGVQMPGGISANAGFFLGDTKDETKRPSGSYFGRVVKDRVVPGAVLFRIDKTWAHSVAGHDQVLAASGVPYVFPSVDPKYDAKNVAPDSPSWKAIAVPGERVRRENEKDPKNVQYARWQHQMTVADVRGDRLMVIETGDTGAGIYEKSVSASMNDEYLFMGVKSSVITMEEITIVGDPANANKD